jgi:hypothetical protein
VATYFLYVDLPGHTKDEINVFTQCHEMSCQLFNMQNKFHVSTPTFRNEDKIQPLTYMKVWEENSGKTESQFVMRKPNKIIYFISIKTNFMFYGFCIETRQIMI